MKDNRVFISIVAIVGIVAIFGILMSILPNQANTDTRNTQYTNLAGKVAYEGDNSINAQKEFQDNDEEYALNIADKITSLQISGSANLKKESSVILVVLVDSNDNQYLVHEGYLLLTDSKYNLVNSCEETCILEAITPKKLLVLTNDAKINIEKITYTTQDGTEESTTLKAKSKENKKQKDSEKVQKLNDNIQKRGLRWTAGETSISQLTYQERKSRVIGLDMQPAKYASMGGLEFYTDGVYDFPTATATEGLSNTAGTFPKSWDWRNTHGENWLTPVKNQANCGSCWDFAANGHAESHANVYYNQHLNLDLSEQDGLSCTDPAGCKGGWPGSVYSYYTTTGAIPESCWTYKAVDITGCDYSTCGYTPQTCDMKCAGWQNMTMKFPQYRNLDYQPATIQKSMITKGPVDICQAWGTSGHCIVYVGYYYDSAGTLVWIFKNSWGTGWGSGGYGTLTNPSIHGAYELSGPIQFTGKQAPQIACNDKDLDGYCNWGVSPTKPSTCPQTCAPEKDCDDSSATVTTETCNIPTTGTLSITSIPEGATVTMDGTSYGLTPVTIEGVSEGYRSIKLSHTGYLDYSTSVNVVVGQTTTVNANMQPIPSTGTLYVTSNPTKSTIYINNAKQGGLTPKTLTLNEGSYTVKVVKKGYKDYITTATISKGQKTTVNAVLTK